MRSLALFTLYHSPKDQLSCLTPHPCTEATWKKTVITAFVPTTEWPNALFVEKLQQLPGPVNLKG